jgi:monoamine oxidase
VGPRRDQLTQRMPMGNVWKIFALYERPFWRDEGLCGQVASEGGFPSIVFDSSPADASKGVLLGRGSATAQHSTAHHSTAQHSTAQHRVVCVLGGGTSIILHHTTAARKNTRERLVARLHWWQSGLGGA